MSQKIRIKLKSYDHNLVDKSAEKIVRTVKATGAIVSGPIPLPTHKRIFTVNRSTFVNKKSREQFELSSYKRLIDIYSSIESFRPLITAVKRSGVSRHRKRVSEGMTATSNGNCIFSTPSGFW